MKKSRYYLFLFVLFFLQGTYLFSGTVDTINLTVSMTGSLSVTIIDDTLALGSLTASETTISNTITVVNSSNGLSASYELTCFPSTPDNWYPKSASGANEFVVRAVFNSTKPAYSIFESGDTLWEYGRTASDVGGNVFVGNQNGYSVAAGDTRNLFLLFQMPATSTSNQQQNIRLALTAKSP